MRGISRIFLFLWLLAGLPLTAQDEAPEPPAEAPAEAPPSPNQRRVPTSIERTNSGIMVVRGSSRKEPAAGAEAPAESEAAGEDGASPDGVPPAADKQPRSEETQRYVYDASGNRRPARTSREITRTDDSESLAVKLRNVNGREVPYLNDTTKVLTEREGLKVSERVKQRFGPNGEPAGQEMERIEERKLPDGTVETVTTVYAQDLNGRMQPAERKVERETESNGVKRTVSTTERASMNGGFAPVLQEEAVERKQGENAAMIEKTIKTAVPGAPLAVTAREETSMRKQGTQQITETTRFERPAAASGLEPVSRTVGKLVERPDGTSSETVESYGYGVPGGPANLNTSRMELQKVVETRTTVGSDGAVQARTTTKERSVANPSEFAAPVVTQQVSKPLPDGESVRTDTYEPGVNGRLRAVESVVEKIEK